LFRNKPYFSISIIDHHIEKNRNLLVNNPVMMKILLPAVSSFLLFFSAINSFVCGIPVACITSELFVEISPVRDYSPEQMGIIYLQENTTETPCSPLFSGGSGTDEDPYLISTAVHLNEIRHYPGASFLQISDVDLGKAPWNSGKGWVPVGQRPDSAFTGSFNGNGYKIINLTVNAPESNFAGLFGQAVSARLKNIYIQSVDITGYDYVGALAGLVIGGSQENIIVTGNVKGHENIGGIFGFVSGTTIRESRSQTVVTGHHFVGGLTGSGKTSGCCATGNVRGISDGNVESSAIGGLIGQGFAMNSYASGEVTGGSEVGGLIGSGSAQGCHANGNVTATGDYIGGLIGDLIFAGEENGSEQEYAAGEAMPPDSIKETKSIISEAGKPVTITLSDGTRVLIPAFPAPLQATLEKRDFDISTDYLMPRGSQCRPTGSMRHLVIRCNSDSLLLKPVITIPKTEAGTINIETIYAVRVGTLAINGEILEGQPFVLPVTVDANGDFKFVDAIFPEGIVPDVQKSAAMLLGGNRNAFENQAEDRHWVGEVRYFLMTFDQSLNWNKRPVLERMIPDSTCITTGFRRPVKTASPVERSKLASQPVCNIVFLVHGHNEQEKAGFDNTTAISPWEYNYKRLVWDLFFEEVAKNRNKELPVGCTAFYEFIYPTYRPVYSPVLSKSGMAHKTLGQDLGNLINKEMEENPQIKAMIEAGIPFNVFFLAHSQGGLTVRAGLRFVNTEILKKLKMVVTWGSPHNGAGLPSLRYALIPGHDMIIDGVRFPMAYIGQTKAYQSGVDGLAIDTPGSRDLRWDASLKELMRLGELFEENISTISEFPEFELPDGREIYNENLRLFNETEGEFTSQLLKNKYLFYEGETKKDAPLEIGWDIWKLRKVVYFGTMASSIEQGAQLNKLVMKKGWDQNDGAVPSYSAGGEKVWPEGNVQRRSVGDIDHEEFYGSEPGQRNETSIAKGRSILGFTFEDMEMKAETRSCPKLELDSKEVNDSLVITGKLISPLYLKINGGDELPGKRIYSIQAYINDWQIIRTIYFKHKDDGTFEGKGKKAEIPDDTLFVVVTLKDGSQVSGKLEQKIRNKVHNSTRNLWYTTIQQAINEANPNDSVIVYPGIYQESLQLRKNIFLVSRSGPEVTILYGKGEGTGVSIAYSSPHIHGFTLQYYSHGIAMLELSGNAAIKPVISNNRIVNNEETGIVLYGKSSPQIVGNIISNNRYYGIDFAKDIIRGDVPTLISKNIISLHDRGIRVNGEIRVDITENSISGNEYGIEMLEKSSAYIAKDTLTGNKRSGVRLYLVEGSSEIIDCLFRQNFTGIESVTNYGNHLVKGSIFDGNQTGISFKHYSSGNCEAQILQNLITGNEGSGISVRISKITIKGNTVSKNKGSGIYTDKCTGEILGNTITGNTNSSGGGIYVLSGGDLSIKQNIISENKAVTYGGGIYLPSQGSAKIEGNTITGNYAGFQGGGIYGTAFGWAFTADVTVGGQTLKVARHVPCFTEDTNSYSGNVNGQKIGSWGPGADKWCDNAGYDVCAY
jgi:parallel beta-helix repeat protein